MSDGLYPCPVCGSVPSVEIAEFDDHWKSWIGCCLGRSLALSAGCTEKEVIKRSVDDWNDLVRDLVRVTRCKDCKFYDGSWCTFSRSLDDQPWMDFAINNDFCSRGKKKEGHHA